MTQWLKRWWSILYIVITVLIVVLLGALSDELPNVWQGLKTMDIRWLAAAVFCFIGYVFFKGVALCYYVRRQGVCVSMRTSVTSAILGLYYNGITPASSGGQPFQVFHLKQRGVPVSVGTSTVGVKFICYQLLLIVLALTLWSANLGLVTQYVGKSTWLLIVGLAVNITGLLLVVLLMCRPRIVGGLIAFCVKLFARMRLIKDPDRTLEKTSRGLDEFHGRVKSLLSHPFDLMVMLFWTMIYTLCFMSIIYCVYRALGLSAFTWDQVLVLQLLLHITVSFMPTPGASGAQEGGFFLFFRGVFPEGHLFTALLIWRFFTYYLMLIAGALTVIMNSLTQMRNARRGGRVEE